MPFDPTTAPPDANLPVPDAAARAHSGRLVERVRGELDAAGGWLGFDRFMELALYSPGLGYYSAGSRKLGEEGDFVTAPELSPLFARCLARQCAEVLERLDGGEILEYGAGSGVMAAGLLRELEALGRLPQRYLIVELSAELRQRQRETLRARVPRLLERVKWLDTPPEGMTGVILANEVLDAMPVHRFHVEAEGPRELGVVWRGGGFGWEPGPPASERLAREAAALQARYDLPPGYESELGLRPADWVRGLAGVLARGVALLIDYGFPAPEFYHPQRDTGTLMCHYRHRAHADPLVLVGLQDITAHVDFSAMAEAAHDAGLEVAGFATQADFLLGNGLTELATADDPREQLDRANQVKRLVLPGEMGELFKVLAVGREVPTPLRGFAQRDERRRL
mgnify:CR=1 FL=1